MAELTRASIGNREDKPKGEKDLETMPAALPQAVTAQLQAGDGLSPAPVTDAEEMVDWDVQIETPPPRPSQSLPVRFVQGDYRRPKILDDPQD